MLEKTEVTIKNGQSRVHKTQNEDKKKDKQKPQHNTEN